MKNIEKSSMIKRETLDEKNYFQSLINKASELEVMNLDDISNLQIQSLELLKLRVERYNGIDSSSIPKDKAEEIMVSNTYTISIYLKKFLPDDAIEKLKTEKIVDMYHKGKQEIEKKLNIARVLYKKVLNNQVITQNRAYNDTINGGIKGFFKIYDPDFATNDIKITADYPTYINLIGVLEGIELIQEYITYIYYENEFCNLFSSEDIEYLLYGYEQDYQDLIINLFQIILTACIGTILAGEEIKNLMISKEGLEKIKTLMNNKKQKEIDQLIEQAFKQLKDNLLKEKKELQSYIEKGFHQVKTEINHAVKTNTLDKIFILKKFI